MDIEVNVSHVKFMGTIIDDKLSWRPHIDYRSKKVFKAIAIMYRLKAHVAQRRYVDCITA